MKRKCVKVVNLDTKIDKTLRGEQSIEMIEVRVMRFKK